MASADDEQVNAPSTALLPLNTELSTTSSSSKRYNTNTFIFITLIIIIAIFVITIAASFAFAVLHNHRNELSRPLRKLKNPVVLLVSSDGFRFGYQFKTFTPNIHRLITNGTEAEQGLIPVFPTLTFPNHYSIVTGLYPAHHGIVNNHFTDPETNEYFSMGSHDAKWWLGEPLWETVTNHGLKAATYFWPGSEVVKGSWNCSTRYCKLKEDLPLRLHYTASDRIPAIIGLIDEGFKVVEKRSDWKKCGGSHGYDNGVFSMRSVFIGHGPRFKKGRKVSSFENVEIYIVIVSILGINGAPNNGSYSFSNSILLPVSS